MKKIAFLFFWLPALALSAQNSNIDSLKLVLASRQTAKDAARTLV